MNTILMKLFAEKLSKSTYIISGKVEIDHLNEKYNLNFPIGAYETIAGFIIDNLGSIPKANETVSFGQL